MVKLRRLTIHRFRQVRPGTTLEFADGFNLILGKNGTGKTTLLELLAAVWSGDFSAYRDEREGLEIEAEFGEGEARVVIRLWSRPEELRVAEVAEPIGRSLDWGVVCEASWTGRAEIVTLEARAKLSVPLLRIRDRAGQDVALDAERTRVYEERVHGLFPELWDPFQARGILYILMNVVFADVVPWLDKARSATRMAQIFKASALPAGVRQASNLRYDEALQWWDRLRSAVRLTGKMARQHGVLVLAHDPTRVPGEFFKAAEALLLAHTRPARDLPEVVQLNSSDGGWLASMASRLGLQRIELIFGGRLVTPRSTLSEPFDVDIAYVLTGVQLIRQDGLEFPMEPGSASFGQMRMFSLLWYLGLVEDVIIADELANGLHHEWIEAALKAIGERQAFLATQHPFLIDYLPAFGDARALRRTFVLCSSAMEAGRELWVWRQLDDRESEEVKADLDVGIMSVNEALMARGLW